MEHQKGPDVRAETLDIQRWRSTVKNNETNEVQTLLETQTENAGLASSSTQDSDANKPQEGHDESSSTDDGSNNKADPLYDVNKSTRSQCIGGIFVGCLLALACITSGIYVLATRKERLAARIDIDATATEMLSLVFNIVLTFCIDSMAFIHSVSLRWALYSEQRLEFNTNLRLLTSSSKSGPNRWYTNVFSMICLAFCYGASSYLLLPTDYLPDVVFLNGVALVVLGLALLGHAIVSTWCLRTRSDSVLTWSSNPLSNCLAAVQSGMLQRREGRCMQPVSDHSSSPSGQGYEHDDMEPVHPLKKQKSIYNSHKHTKMIIILLWTLAILATGWVFTILGLDLAYAADSGNYCPPGATTLKWDVQAPGSCDSNMASLSMSFSQKGDGYDQDKYPLLQVCLGLLFITAIQATQSFALHCTELLVNISRDENHWRKAYDGIGTSGKCPKGSLLASDSLKNALTSWEYITLSIFKSLLHWSVGQALLPSMNGRFIGPVEFLTPSSVEGEMALAGITFYMTYTRLMLYAGLAILLAAFATFLALRKRSGPQPATVGHLQTIADLVDDWTLNEKGRIFWGDKGADTEAEIRHAGTSSDPDALEKICLDAIYAG
ncbi:uncharacterized protein FIESC28_01477 [Fusarium coffeatum]|uniref:Uncharacterized protein n=1 Tax=Fusarium coffeatum TaxID=231269 RepID=A0A366S8T8_9HYPO|nr:uncharacterized protein FIESC28_01477 [Fusarium coffeatum]RBR25724.1 hypothetical protein FIESC28_01477 [Fusarium coffeatum]